MSFGKLISRRDYIVRVGNNNIAPAKSGRLMVI